MTNDTDDNQKTVDPKNKDRLSDADFEYIIEEEDKIKEKLQESRSLTRFTKDAMLLIHLIKDYYQGNYRNIPYKTLSAGVIGLLYILNPIDIIPDFIPLIGYIDDALVITLCLKLIEKDLQKYQAWKQNPEQQQKSI